MTYNKESFKNEFSSEEVSHMTKSSISAFIKLKKAGCPVKVWHQNDPKYMDYRGYFWIDTEESGAESWLDYYNQMMGHEKLVDILDTAGLYFEWENSAVACVFDN